MKNDEQAAGEPQMSLPEFLAELEKAGGEPFPEHGKCYRNDAGGFIEFALEPHGRLAERRRCNVTFFVDESGEVVGGQVPMKLPSEPARYGPHPIIPATSKQIARECASACMFAVQGTPLFKTMHDSYITQMTPIILHAIERAVAWTWSWAVEIEYYAQHKHGCDLAGRSEPNDEFKCTCGLDAARKRVGL